MSKSKKSVLITGGSRGLGAHFVRQFARQGYDVYFTYQTHEADGNALVEEVSAPGTVVRSFAADVRDEARIAEVVSQIEAESGGLAALVNSAGISRDGMSWKLDSTSWRETIDVNLTGTFNMIRAVVPAMRERRFGRIINISSVVADRGIAGTVAYSSSKSALFGLTRTIAKEVASRGITVNCLVLGYFEAGMGTKLPAAVREATIQAIPAGRFGDPEKLAKVVSFFCSDDCDYITGQEIVIDGGFLA